MVLVLVLVIVGTAAFFTALIVVAALQANQRIDNMRNFSGRELNNITKRVTLIERKLGVNHKRTDDLV